jgi:pimeloyl-ACP methyl ester carboxylesterase
MREGRRSLGRLSGVALSLLAAFAAVGPQRLSAQDSTSERPPLVIQKMGNFFVGGDYSTRNDTTRFVGQMYVEFAIPDQLTHRYPIVFVHGGGQIGSGWWRTPDGRQGWALYFLRRGYAVYVVDQPARGRSPYNSELGPLGDPAPVLRSQQLWAAPERFELWPAARLHTRWVGSAEPGDRTFDQFMRSQSDAIANIPQQTLTADALIALLKRIGPAILVPHSQPGWAAWRVADFRPDLVKGLIQLEPGPPARLEANPPFGAFEVPWGLSYDPLAYSPHVSDPSQLQFVEVPVTDDPYVKSCWLQAEPARELPHLQQVPILLLTSEAGYNTLWDPCTHRYLEQAGVEHTWIRLPEIGIHGNGHFYFIEENSNEVAGVVRKWLASHVKDQTSGSNAVAAH